MIPCPLHSNSLSLFGLLILLLSGSSNAQHPGAIMPNESDKSYYVTVSAGLQMSGIKDEDFVPSNYTPLLNIVIGKRISEIISLEAGYKGYYFNYIMDDVKHYYSFIYGGSAVSVSALLNGTPQNLWDMSIHAALGYFKNNVPDKSSVCANIGVTNSFVVTENFSLTADVSSVIGWDIYQGNWDILPGVTLGVSYRFY